MCLRSHFVVAGVVVAFLLRFLEIICTAMVLAKRKLILHCRRLCSEDEMKMK